MKNGQNIPDWVAQLIANDEGFWTTIYPAYAFDERVKHWSGSLYRQMRWNGESGADPYGIYCPEWYHQVKKLEPQIDAIMDILFSRNWRGIWSQEEYLKRIIAE